MEPELLMDKGLSPKDPKIAYLEGHQLIIGERATLIPSVTGKVYGIIVNLLLEEVKQLYQEKSVADYQPEKVLATLANQNKINVLTYKLPPEKVTGESQTYVQLLIAAAQRSGLPQSYIHSLRDFLH